MDSLFWKIGPSKALASAKAGQHCEGSDLQPRSVQVCVCRSPSSQAKPTSAIASSAPPAQETSTTPSDPPFNPLPLPSPRTSVPGPLKFLWFNRRNNRTPVEKRVPEQGGVLHGEERSSKPLSIQSNGEVSTLGDPTERIEMQKEDTWDESSLKECSDVASMHATHLDSLLEPESADTVMSNVIMANVDSISTKRNWLSRITDFKALWPNRKDQTGSLDAVKLHTTSSKCETTSTHSRKCAGTCEGCELNASHECSLEVPYNKLLHSKESFSKFLQNASLFDMKVLSQMSFLCDMAYTIPDIQPGQLLKYHHLRFITSSLDKKAEAEAKTKEAELLKKALRNDKDMLTSNGGKGGGSSSEGKPFDTNFVTSSVEATTISLHTSSASHFNTTENDTTHISKELGASAGFQSELQQVKDNTHISEGEEELGPSEESLMAVAPVTAVVLAEEETKLAVTKDLQASSSCPCEWFVCDDPSIHTRFFVIQGSESLASWQANLFFEPTKFEGLDVLVHRGIYEAANALYEQVLPEVLAHFSTHGDLAQVRLTGHSLGGSLATLLALMFQIRGVILRKSILPVVTFGSPCIMCGGDYLLQKMGLPPNHIQSIIMHRDVVPRAFSCDYPDHVAQILKRLNGKFRDHPCLNNQKLLYAPMGQLLILQPDETTAPSHPLLPRGHGLYLLRHPTNEEGIERSMELRAAQRAFLNMPHPLEILSDPGAYGLNGAISRDHNPCSYTKAIHVVLRHEVKRLRHVQREQRRQLWWPLVIAESSLSTQRGLNSSPTGDQVSVNRALTPGVCRTSMFFRQPVNYGTSNWIGFSALGSSSLWVSQKAAFSRYARLIASKHVQMGMLFIISLRVVIEECLSKLYVWI